MILWVLIGFLCFAGTVRHPSCESLPGIGINGGAPGQPWEQSIMSVACLRCDLIIARGQDP
jgi:hypothetical protein